MSAPQPTATGTLASRPLLHLLVYALDRRLRGTLVIEDRRHLKSAVLFLGGAPVKVKCAEPVAPLTAVLVDLHATDEETAERARKRSAAGKGLQGQALLEAGHLDRETLESALAEQVARRVEWLAALRPDSVYGYYDGQDFLRGYGGDEPVPVEPLAVIWRCLKKQVDPRTLEATLARLGDQELRLHPQARMGRFGFDAREQALADVLRVKPMRLTELLGAGLLDSERARQLVYLLVVTRHLEVAAAGRAPVGAGSSGSSLRPSPGDRSSMTSAPPSVDRPRGPRTSTESTLTAPSDRPRGSSLRPGGASGAQVEAFKKEIHEAVEAIDEKTYYEVLGVDRDAPTATIQAAFFALAKRWHPDRLGPELDDVRTEATRVFSRMSEAHQILGNEESRQEYDRLNEQGGGTADEQEEVQRVVRAAAAFQKAEVLLKKGDAAAAEEEAARAVEQDPQQAEYLALYADILSQKAMTATPGDHRELVQMVNRARKMQPENPRVRLYRARVLKRSGDEDGAMREYRYVVRHDARNVEAARELRLHEMRRESGRRSTGPRGKSTGGSLIDKLFKR